MLSVILIDEAGKADWNKENLGVLSSSEQISEIFVISETISSSSEGKIRSMPAGASLTETFKQALAIVASKRVLILNSAVKICQSTIDSMLKELQDSPLSSHYCASTTEDREFHWSASELIQNIATRSDWPVTGVSTTRSYLKRAFNLNITSIREGLLSDLVLALSEDEEVRSFSDVVELREDSLLSPLTSLDEVALSRILNLAVDGFNIEELFPNHAWKEHSQESAAAAYHSLSALFLSLNDINSANECLKCSENLEESPRYFALKAFIAKEKGETLGAVANLVSSLQYYESRKKNDGEHYLAFNPTNLEEINSRLVAGLDALNSRDTERALTNFAQAVFKFDPLFKKFGISEKK